MPLSCSFGALCSIYFIAGCVVGLWVLQWRSRNCSSYIGFVCKYALRQKIIYSDPARYRMSDVEQIRTCNMLMHCNQRDKVLGGSGFRVKGDLRLTSPISSSVLSFASSTKAPWLIVEPWTLRLPYNSLSNSPVFLLTSCFSSSPVLLFAAFAKAKAALSGVIWYPPCTSIELNCASCQTPYIVMHQTNCKKTNIALSMLEKPHSYDRLTVSGRHRNLSCRKVSV